MTDTITLPVTHHDLHGRLDRLFTRLMTLAAFDDTRKALTRLSQMSDADVAATGRSRDAIVRQILGARAIF